MPNQTQIVGILNVTPDSFSDGGIYNTKQTALAHTQSMITSGVHVIDVGAESTRPNAIPLTAQEEWARLANILPNIISAAHAAKVLVSVDTRHVTTAKLALAEGVDWINDVSGLQNPEMLAVLANSTCNIVCMHSLSIPADSRITLPEDSDVIETLTDFAKAAIVRAANHGIARDRIIFDVGIGFGKSATQSLQILRRIDELRALELPLFIGHSRKSFLNQYTPLPVSERDGLTLAVSEYLMQKNIAYLRVHNVARHTELLALHKDLHAS